MKRFWIAAVLLVLSGLAAYGLARGCFRFLVKTPGVSENLLGRLSLTDSQRSAVAAVEADYMKKKKATCELLCAKRAQLIQTMKQPKWDRDILFQLVQEIGQEQTLFEQETIDYLTALNQHLDEPQKQRLKTLVAEELRNACQSTACGGTSGHSLHEEKAP